MVMAEAGGMGVHVGVMVVPPRTVGMGVPMTVPPVASSHGGPWARVVVEVARRMGMEMRVVMVAAELVRVVVPVAVSMASPSSVPMVTRQEGAAA